MAQQNINYGAFPDDLNADAIRAAFQKTQENFTELYSGAATAGVSRIIAGPGITLQGSSSGTGNVTVAASLSAINVVTDELQRNLIIAGSPLVNSQGAISINVNQNEFTVNNFIARDTVTMGERLAMSLDANNNIVLGGINSRIDGQYITGITAQPYQDANTIAIPGQVQFSAQLGNGQNIITGSQAFRFDTNSNLATILNATVTGNTTLSRANINSATITGVTDSSSGDTTQGALVVNGGMSVQRSVSLGNAASNHTISGNVTVPVGNLQLNGNTVATSLGQGTFIIRNSGGASIGGNLFVGGFLQTPSLSLSNTAATLGPGTGALIIAGGGSIAGNLEVGGYANIGANARVGANIAVIGNASVGGNISVTGTISANGNLNAGNVAGNTIQANTDIIGNAYFRSNATATTINSVFANISSATNIAGPLTVNNIATFAANVTLGANAALVIQNAATSSNTTSGALRVQGGAGIGGNINVGGSAGISGDLTLSSNLIVTDGTANISARGAPTYVQYNNAGNLAGSANFTWNNSTANLIINGNSRATTLLSTNIQASYAGFNGVIQYASDDTPPVPGLAFIRSDSSFRFLDGSKTLLVPNANVSANLVASNANFTTNVAIANVFTANANSISLGANTTVSSNLTVTGTFTAGNTNFGANGANVSGNLTVSGNVILSNASANISAKGADTQIQYNNSGNLAGSANFTWNNSTANLTVTGNTISNTIVSANIQASYTNTDGVIQFANVSTAPSGLSAVIRSATNFLYTSSTSTLQVPNANLAASINVANVFSANAISVAISANTTVSNNLTVTGTLTAGNTTINANGANVSGNLTVSGNVILSNTSANISAKGADTQIQYNNSGNLAGSTAFTWNNANSNLTVIGNTISNTLVSANIQASYAGIDGVIQYASNSAPPVPGLAFIRSNNNFRYVAANSTLVVSNANVTTNITTASIAVGSAFTANASNVSIAANTAVSNNLSVSGNVTFTGSTFSANTVNVRFSSLGIGTPASGTAGEIRATNDITAFYSSDARFKTNVKVIDDALSKAAAISGYFFDWRDEFIASRGGEDGYFVNKHDIGVIAQEVQPHIPQAVKTRPDGTLAVDYPKLVALCLAALAEVKQELDKLKGKQ